MILNH